MKQKFLFLAVATATLFSCSDNSVIDSNNGGAVSFRPLLDKTTRANTTLLSNLGAFNVTAVGNSANYFTDLAVTTTDNGTTWNTASTYYWPSHELHFYAYSPQAVSGNATINSTTKTIAFTPDAAVANQKDLVVAYNTGTKAANMGTGVPLKFQHALSQIEIQAKCMNSNIKIEVKGVRIVNPATSATFTFPTAATTAALPQSLWTAPSGENVPANAYAVSGTSTLNLNTTAQSIMFGDNNFMLIPQQLTGWDKTPTTTGAYIAVLCRISSLNGSVETLLYPEPTASDNKVGKYAYSAVPIATNWEPGKKYIYTLEFCGTGSGGGYVDPNPGTNDGDPNPVPAPGQGGDPILGNPIKFTVDVENWVPVSTPVQM